MPEWAEPDPQLISDNLPQAPELPLNDAFGPRLAQWVLDAAQAKGAPADYVFAAVLAIASSVIGNKRWVSPWNGWEEPPILWFMCIGLPSSGKSPAIDSVVRPLREVESGLRREVDVEHKDWAERAELAKLFETAWKEAAKKAIKSGETPPERPDECNIGPAPHFPRLLVNDATIESLGVILDRQPHGILQMRDELAGWLQGMQRYSGGGSDRPFWLEAYGGRGFSVERVGRESLTIERLTIGVLGGIQPARLDTLLLKADDDGLLARLLPIWPNPAPLSRPGEWNHEALLRTVLEKLMSLDFETSSAEEFEPVVLAFTEDAQDLMDEFRQTVRGWEEGADGLMVSFMGKLTGLAVRLSLVLACLDWASEGGEEPREIGVNHFGRAAHLVEVYLLPMARRAYSEAAMPKDLRAARRLVSIIREKEWRTFSTRDVLRFDRSGLGTVDALNPALSMLENGDCIRILETPAGPKGGRPRRQYAVNPAIHGL